MTNASEHYKILNNSFKNKELIYPLSNRGFFSEINNLAQAVLYCLEEKIHLKIYSKKWVSGALSDYFENVIEEYNGVIPVTSDVFCISRYDKIWLFYHKVLKNRKVLQNDIWHKMHSETFTSKMFHFPTIGINGNILSAKKEIYKLILQHNKTTDTFINSKNFINHDFVKLSCGIHIRRGDKVFNKNSEAAFIDIKKYIDKALSVDAKINKFTICTDDYSVVEDLRSNYPTYEFYTLCSKNSQGYDQSEFNSKNINDKKSEVLNILVDSQLLIDSEYFIGTYSSNVSRFVAIMRDNKNSFSLDLDLNSH